VDSLDCFLGVGGGNSKTVALVATAAGAIAGWGRGGRGDIYGVAAPEEAVAAVERAAADALAMAGLARGQLAASCFSLAGADWPEDFAFWEEALAGLGFGPPAAVVNDAIGALYAALPAGPGVVVACGTGAATGARGAEGELWHSSFWQLEQGGEALGKKMLDAVTRAELGVGPATSLTGRALAFFGLATVEELLHHVTRRGGRPRPAIAALARVLLDEAAAGDAVARAIVAEHGEALGDSAVAAAGRVGIAGLPYPLALVGGVLRHRSPLLGEAIAGRVRQNSPSVQVVRSEREPAVGALLLAMERGGHPAGAAVLDQLTATGPPARLFET
jgi:N-acetylglucosamine kinase-like BadF-type ATPase